jgi:hypothetical protein
MIKISKSFSELDNKSLLNFCNHKNDLKVKISNKKLFNDLRKENEIKKNNDDESLNDFERIIGLNTVNFGIENDTVVFKKDTDCHIAEIQSQKENKKDSILIDEKCLNLNKFCSKCTKKFKNSERFIKTKIANEEINLNMKCFNCSFCEEDIQDFYVLDNTEIRNENESSNSSLIADESNRSQFEFKFYHPNCFFKQRFNLLCFLCRNEITDRVYFIINNLTYHLNCVKCRNCNRNFNDETMVSKFLSNFYCFECLEKLDLVFVENMKKS